MKEIEQESQIRQIAHGRSTREKRYGIRSQPAGQSPSATEGNAAKLTAVPSSAEEKYRGGRD
jgi:hypothetical protein